MQTINGKVGIYAYEIEQPEELIFAYSRHVYIRARITSDNIPVQGLNVRLIITDNDKHLSLDERRYTDSDGRVTFDIARILQVMTDNREEEMSSLMYDANDFALWAMKLVSINIAIDTGMSSIALPSLFPSHIIANGAHDNARDWWNNTTRENPLRLKWWVSYPFTYDQINTEAVRVSQNGSWSIHNVQKADSNNPLQLVRFNPYGLGITADRALIANINANGLSVIDGVVYTSNKRNFVQLDIDRCSRSDRKTYLRWLGGHGEVFYWLFDNITEDVSVKSETYQRAMVDDTFRGLVTNKMRDNGVIKDSTATRTRTIATEYLDNGYYDIVQSVASSPYVDMFIGSEDNEKWQRVNVADGSFSRSMKMADRAKRNRIVLTIEIPEI